jgi:hypothetical protein
VPGDQGHVREVRAALDRWHGLPWMDLQKTMDQAKTVVTATIDVARAALDRNEPKRRCVYSPPVKGNYGTYSVRSPMESGICEPSSGKLGSRSIGAARLWERSEGQRQGAFSSGPSR